MENKIAMVTGIAGAVISYMFNWVGVAVTALLFFMLADYFTGLIAAGINKELNFSKGFNGFAKKMYILVLIGSIYLLEYVALHYTDFDIFGGHIGDGAALAYIAVEVISIAENGVKMNAPIPKFVKNVLKIVKDNVGHEEDAK
ncbi:phage holin family protein [Metasolibacillus meyeri]|uniref:phage holin family protein n=1 Tax=Metasolibacillus meyeri TaxID=1071052 RepID=UPI000D2F78B3|nr:phage holin family protein [Metasolibacillus meyeri]